MTEVLSDDRVVRYNVWKYPGTWSVFAVLFSLNRQRLAICILLHRSEHLISFVSLIFVVSIGHHGCRIKFFSVLFINNNLEDWLSPSVVKRVTLFL